VDPHIKLFNLNTFQLLAFQNFFLKSKTLIARQNRGWKQSENMVEPGMNLKPSAISDEKIFKQRTPKGNERQI
jgi:hypothetical protein